MNHTIKRVLSALLAFAIVIPYGIMNVSAAETELLYSLTAEDFNSDMTQYGMSYNTTSVIWSLARQTDMAESVNSDAIRFSTRGNIGDNQLVKHTFAKDTQNTPEAFTDGTYILETEFAPLYKNDGYLAMNVYGKNTSGSESSIAQLRFTASSNTSGKAYFTDASGNAVGEELDITPSVEAGKYAAAVYYVKYEIDLNAGTYSAWFDTCKTPDSDYKKIEAGDDNLIVDSASLNASDIAELTAYSFDITESTYTNGIWFKSVSVSKIASQVSDDDESVIKRAQKYLDTLKIVKNASDVSGDLTLPSTWTHSQSDKTLDIVWTSSDKSIYTDDGKYVGEEQPAEDKTVVMNAKIALGSFTAESDYTLTVKKFSNEVLIDYEDFSGKTVSGNKIDGWEFYDMNDEITEHSALTLSMDAGQLKITKNSTNESNYQPRYKSMYRFKREIEKYTPETRTETYQTGFNGQYKVVAHVTHSVSSGAQFQLQNLATGSDDTTPAIPFQICITSSNIYEYVSGTSLPEIYPSSVAGKEATFTYEFDTATGKESVQVNDGSVYQKDVTSSTLQGLMFIHKEQAKAGDYIKIRDIALYSLNGDDSTDNKAIAAAKKLSMSDITADPSAVTDSLSLPGKISGATVTWTSSDTDVISNGGSLLERSFDSDTDVIMTAKVTVDSDTVYKKFYLTVARETDPQKIVERVASNLTYSTITSENVDHITKDLNLPTSGVYNTVITWKSSNTEYISDSGKLLKRDDESNIPVTLTATISLGEASVQKSFYVTVYLNYKESDTAFYSTDFTTDTIADNITTTPGSGSISQSDGKMALARTSGGSATGVKIYPQFGSKQMSIAREFTMDADITMDSACRKAEIILYDKSGNRITTMYTTKRSTYTLVYRNSLSADATHDAVSLGKAGENGEYNIHMKVNADPDTKIMTVSASVNGGEYRTIASKYIRENASALDYIAINNLDDTAESSVSNKGTLYINSVSVKTADGLVPYIIDDNMGYTSQINALGGMVIRNIDLITDAPNGVSVSWKSSDSAILSASGVLDRSAYTEDTPITLTLSLSIDKFPDVAYNRDFTLIAKYVDPRNISFGTTASTQDCSSYAGHGPEKAIDGLENTSWYTLRSEENPKLVIDLGHDNVITGYNILAAEVSGKYNIDAWELQLSRDGKTWKKAASGSSLAETAATGSISPAIARYARFAVTKNAGGNCGLSELALTLDTTGKARAEADILLAADSIGSLTNLTKDVTLPTTGFYGSTLSYVSSISSNFSNTGKVSRSTNTVSGKLTITAEYNGEKASSDIAVSVSGTSSGSGSGSGSGGSVISGGSSNSSAGGPAYPTTSTVTDNKLFGDIDSSHWAYDYVKNLKAAGVVSGNENGEFLPSANVSREEFVKMLLSALTIDCTNYAPINFNDIKAGDWCEPYVAKAYELGIVNGISADTFGKGSPITRQDMAVMAVNAMKAAGKYVSSPADLSAFSDAALVSAYATDSVGIMSNMGIINGYSEDNTLRPANNASRAEAAVIIYKLMK